MYNLNSKSAEGNTIHNSSVFLHTKRAPFGKRFDNGPGSDKAASALTISQKILKEIKEFDPKSNKEIISPEDTFIIGNVPSVVPHTPAEYNIPYEEMDNIQNELGWKDPTSQIEMNWKSFPPHLCTYALKKSGEHCTPIDILNAEKDLQETLLRGIVENVQRAHTLLNKVKKEHVTIMTSMMVGYVDPGHPYVQEYGHKRGCQSNPNFHINSTFRNTREAKSTEGTFNFLTLKEFFTTATKKEITAMLDPITAYAMRYLRTVLRETITNCFDDTARITDVYQGIAPNADGTFFNGYKIEFPQNLPLEKVILSILHLFNISLEYWEIATQAYIQASLANNLEHVSLYATKELPTDVITFLKRIKPTKEIALLQGIPDPEVTTHALSALPSYATEFLGIKKIGAETYISGLHIAPSFGSEKGGVANFNGEYLSFM